MFLPRPIAVVHVLIPQLLASALVLMAYACGGRTQLIPAYQIGRLSPDAVVAHDGDVRVVVRTAEWPGPTLHDAGIIPVQLTFVNGSSHALQVAPSHASLVTSDRERIAPLPPADALSGDPRADTMRERALTERTIAPDERTSGFVYFPEPRDGSEVTLQIDLVDGTTDASFGSIEIPFSFD